MRWFWILSVGIMCAWPTRPANAQHDSFLQGELVVQITDDESEETLAKAEVTLTAQDGTRYRGMNDHRGRYVFRGLPVGSYSVWIRAFQHQPGVIHEHVGAAELVIAVYRLKRSIAANRKMLKRRPQA